MAFFSFALTIRRRIVVLLVGLFAGSIFLLSGVLLRAEGGMANHLVISEIRITGGTGKSTDEFVEFYNPTSQVISLSNWKLAKLTRAAVSGEYTMLIDQFPINATVSPHGYYLAAHKDYQIIDGNLPDTVYSSGSLADDNSVVLLDGAGAVIDLVGWGKAQMFETSAAPLPTNVLPSLERRPGSVFGNGEDSNNNSVDYVRAVSSPRNSTSLSLPTIRNEISVPGAIEEVVEEVTVTEELVNESVSSANAESGKDNLDSIRSIVSSTTPVGLLESSNSIDLVESFGAGAINTSSAIYTSSTSEILAKIETTTTLDTETMLGTGVILHVGEASSTDMSTEATSITNTSSIITSTSDNTLSFNSSSLLGVANSLLESSTTSSFSESENALEMGALSLLNIVISEVMVNPVSGAYEWIELYNLSSSTANLSGWILYDSNGEIAAPTSTIAAGGFAVITLSSAKLNNNGDEVILKDSTGLVRDNLRYGDNNDGVSTPGQGNSLIRDIALMLGEFSNATSTLGLIDTWSETTTPTYGAVNQLAAPYYVIASTQMFSSSGNESLGNNGGGNSVSNSVSNNNISNSAVNNSGVSITMREIYARGDVLISEIVSDPADGGTEFVELVNVSGHAVMLDGWWIADGSGMKTPLTGTLPQGAYHVIESPKGVLNNAGDKVTVYDYLDKEIDAVSYGNWDDGQLSNNAPVARDPFSIVRVSYAGSGYNLTDRMSENEFVLTTTVTKGTHNIITSINTKSQLVTDKMVMPHDGVLPVGGFPISLYDDTESEIGLLKIPDSTSPSSVKKTTKKIAAPVAKNATSTAAVKKTSASKIVKKTTTKTTKVINVMDISGLQARKFGERVRVTGVVTALPGIFGSGILYIQEDVAKQEKAKSGIQIYYTKKPAPTLRLGDIVEVSGDLAEIGGERRIKVTDATDIKIISHAEMPEPVSLVFTGLTDTSVGSLVELVGEVTDVKSGYLYLDDGNGEIKVVVKRGTGIGKLEFREGQKLQVVGVLSRASDSFQLLPRSKTDFTLLTRSEIVDATSREVRVGQTTSGNILTRPWVLMTLGVLPVIGLGYIARVGIARKAGSMKKTVADIFGFLKKEY